MTELQDNYYLFTMKLTELSDNCSSSESNMKESLESAARRQESVEKKLDIAIVSQQDLLNSNQIVSELTESFTNHVKGKHAPRYK